MDLAHLMPLVNQLDRSQIEYNLGGSAVLYASGLTDTIRDWDLIVHSPRESLIQALDGYGWVERVSGDPPFASRYRISIPELQVEMIGGFALRTAHGIVCLPGCWSGLWHGVRLASPEVWYVAYALMGRSHQASLLLNDMRDRHSADPQVVSELLSLEALNPDIKLELHSLL